MNIHGTRALSFVPRGFAEATPPNAAAALGAARRLCDAETSEPVGDYNSELPRLAVSQIKPNAKRNGITSESRSKTVAYVIRKIGAKKASVADQGIRLTGLAEFSETPLMPWLRKVSSSLRGRFSMQGGCETCVL